MPAQQEAFFLPLDDGRSGQRFCLFHPAHGQEPSGSVFYIHPFAEEMNKSRRMAALQARALARAGYHVLQLDLLGCGDSSGDFGAATWHAWVNDVVQGCHWLRRQSNGQVTDSRGTSLWLWGLRAGCLLAVDASRQLAEACNFMFWQPPAAGKQLLHQFLRLKVAGDMLGGQAKGVTDGLRSQLAAGAAIDVAGYSLSPRLASGLEQALLEPPVGMQAQESLLRLEWFELSTREDATLSPVSVKTSTQWGNAGFSVRTHVVNGTAFWQTSEIEEAPALITATVAALAPVQHAAAA